MGEVIFRELAARAGLADRFEITSSGTHEYHVGAGADPRGVAALSKAGYDGSQHRASQLSDAEIEGCDLLIALDRGHEEILLRRGASPDRIALLTAFDPERPSDPDVFDPYYSEPHVYDEVLVQVERSCVALLAHLSKQQVT